MSPKACDSQRKCSEIGATLRYERKVAENPIVEAHKKAYRRFNSRTRAKKMTQNEFMAWSEEAAKKRDECLAGELLFDEFKAWLEKGRIRKSRASPLTQIIPRRTILTTDNEYVIIKWQGGI
ncbi:MAG: DUF6076 domain-containing protein [Clostridiales bacterium]|jgi:hypothetical protein|nr:DUF6076 domain-containing protein [Clostridiales bacterium]